jgi:hypothetical protein
MDKQKTDHWGVIPYNHEKQKCSYYTPRETDTFHHDDIVSDYEERENEPPLNKPK